MVPSSPSLPHVEAWIFDLDNTLYPSSSRLFDQVSRRITLFLMSLFQIDEAGARERQRALFRRHGTTLRGLMLEHGVEPSEFLDFVHDIDVAVMAPAPLLDQALANLGGRKLVFTNGSVPHAERILERLGIGRHFEAIHDIVASDYVPKPDPAPYLALIERHGIEAERTAMVEDMAINLKPAHALGMTTVWVKTEHDWAAPGEDAGHIHYRTDDLPAWLEGVASYR
ncbi:MAG: pyrimidine 5'-nucleotidase [Proteobacteria bacterium]|nr:pyrimidine 5'-nucleotidase [Pseudomonadota bacterium]MBI3499676.1 pyrimidine 5'-nucleotidase [Pseudomonadota bacterium]